MWCNKNELSKKMLNIFRFWFLFSLSYHCMLNMSEFWTVLFIQNGKFGHQRFKQLYFVVFLRVCFTHRAVNWSRKLIHNDFKCVWTSYYFCSEWINNDIIRMVNLFNIFVSKKSGLIQGSWSFSFMSQLFLLKKYLYDLFCSL